MSAKQYTLQELWEGLAIRRQLEAIRVTPSKYQGEDILDIVIDHGILFTHFHSEDDLPNALREFGLRLINEPEADGPMMRLLIGKVQPPRQDQGAMA